MTMTDAEVTRRKAALRKEALARRAALDTITRANADSIITAVLLNCAPLRAARRVLAYMSFRDEFETQALVSAVLAAGKSLVLPRVNKERRRLDLYEVQELEHQLGSGVWGIREPVPERCAPAVEAPDLAIVPGVAFDPAGERLGYGGGYYDQLLARLHPRPLLLAPAFDVQIVEQVPCLSTDIRVDAVVTETQVLGPYADQLQ